jgi:signal transduction histidine kinase
MNGSLPEQNSPLPAARPVRSNDLGFISGQSEMARRIRSFAWDAHPLGPPANWPRSLKILIQIMLTSRYAMWMGWGEEFYFFCNDAYLPTVGLKRDWVLGASARKVWAEIWPDIGPRAESVVRTGNATWDEALRLFLERSGYSEETYHTFSYSPVPDDQGSIGGMLCVVTEETERVIGERRLAALRDIAAELDRTRTEDELFNAVARLLQKHPHDVPFGLIYLFDTQREWARLVCAQPATADSSIAPQQIAVAGARAVWPIPPLASHGGMVLIEDLATRFQAIPKGVWDQPPKQAALVPLMQQGQEGLAGFFIAGLNPYRPFDTEYRGFIELAVGQIAAALANVRSYEQERRRAEALAELDRAKTTFFSNISHEFRTPLALILGSIEEELHAAPGPKENLQLAHRSSLRLLKLVNSLLDFSRIEAGRMEASFEPIDLSACTADLASVFRSAIEKAGLRLVVDCPPMSQPVYVDRDMWEKIVLNLISNAFKFTFQGHIVVSLQTSADWVKVAVRDTGVGIPDTELPKIFERFHRVRGTRSRTFEGTGIGLALVQELVGLQGGTIQVESAENQGTTFTVSLRMGTAHLPADRISAPRRQVSTNLGAGAFVEEALRWLPEEDEATGAPLVQSLGLTDDSGEPSPARILLADDNADVRDYLRRLLSRSYQVQVVADGEAALQAIQTEPPDLVLTDVMMPKLDGFDLLERVRADDRTRSIPFIMLSARAGEEARIDGLRAGADDYLTKPFSARELLARVRSQLTMARLRHEAFLRERELRAQIETHAQELERTVARRTAKLRETVAELEHFSYAITHDMRAPLRAMEGFAGMLEEECQANPTQLNLDYVRRIKAAAARLDQLITDSLNYSKTVRQELPTEPVDLGDLLSNLIETYPNLQPDKADIQLESNLPIVFGNAAGLTQCFANLLGNAVKFGKAGVKPRIRVWAEPVPRPAASENRPPLIRVWIEDNGIGIPSHSLERVFGMFQRATKDHEGTGIGLAIVRKVVERMGGRAGVESVEGEGSRFWVDLHSSQSPPAAN